MGLFQYQFGRGRRQETGDNILLFNNTPLLPSISQIGRYSDRTMEGKLIKAARPSSPSQPKSKRKARVY